MTVTFLFIADAAASDAEALFRKRMLPTGAASSHSPRLGDDWQRRVTARTPFERR